MSTKHPRQPGSNRPKSSPLMMALEPRIMFDGAAIATAVDAAHNDVKPAGIDASEHLAPPPAAQTIDLAALATPVIVESAKPATEIVFIDGSLPDVQQLQNGVKAGVEVVILDPTRNGLNQIADYLDGRTGIEAIHIVSHGHQGEITLGSFDLNQASINQQADTLARIGNSLGADGDILLYGCQVGAGEIGNAFVTQLASLTHADVAASIDNTGNTSLLANWNLEKTTGAIEHDTPFTAELLADYQHVLPTTLAAGDIAVIGINTDGTNTTQTWAFVPLVELTTGTVIHFTDDSITENGVFLSTVAGTTNEGHMTWTVPSTITAGTVLVVTNDNNSAGGYQASIVDLSGTSYGGVSGTVGGTVSGFNTSGEQIFVYQGTAGTTTGATFIYGLNTSQSATNTARGGWVGSTAMTTASFQTISYRPTGLVDGTSAAVLTTNVGNTSSTVGGNYGFDNMRYNGITSGTKAQLLAAIGNASNWLGDDTTTYTFSAVLADFTVSTPPSLVSATFADNALKIGETSSVTFVFNTAVTGFTTTDLTIPNGHITGLSTSDGGTTWVGTFTPDSGITDATNVITVDLTGVTSVSGSLAGTGTADSSNYAIDTLAPTVSSVSATSGNGHYVTGQTVDVTVTFNDNVTVTGTPQITLETGSTDRTANYLSGSGTNTLTFRYTVQAGDTSLDLDYVSTSALAFNGGSIRDSAGNDATLTLASPGTAGSLGANKAIVIDSAPGISNLNGDSVAWAGVGGTVTLDVSGNAAISDTEFGALNSGNGNWSGASLTVQRNGTAVSADVLGFNTTGALFTVSGSNLQSGGLTFATFTNTGGVLTITFTSSGTAATTALVQDVTQHITYRNDTPAGDATVRFALSDGYSSTNADVTVTSDTIYVTNTTDTTTINVSDGVSFSEAVAIAAADVTGSQTLVFSSNFATTVSLAGSLSINESLTLNADSASGLIISGGSTITLGGGTTLTWTSSGTATISATLGGSGSLLKTGTGTLSLSSASNEANMSGGITVNAGTLLISSDDHLSSGTLTLDGGTLTNSVTAMTIDNNIVIGASGGTFNIGGGAGATSVVLSGVVSGSGTLTKNGQAILELSGNNTYTGATNVTAGTIIASHANAFGTTAGATTVTSGATVRIAGGLTVAESFSIAGTGKAVSSVNYGALHLVSGSTTVSGTVTLTSAADISAASGASLTISGAMSGAFALNKTDAGTLILSNSGTEAGLTAGTSITAGTLSVANDDYLSSGTITLNGGTLAITGATTIDNAVTVSSASTITTSSNATLSGVLGGSGTLTKSGASTLTLNGTNTHSGAVSLTAGGLTLSGGSAIGNTSAITQSASTVLTISTAETIGSLAGTGSVVLNAALTTGGDNTTTSYAGVISGTSGLTKAGSGTMTLTGNNTYTGATNISAGGLTVNRVGGALDDNTSVTVASGAIFTVSADETIDGLAGAGTVALGTSGLTIGINGTSSTFSGSVTGSGSLTLDGGGTFTLSGTNSGQSWGMQVLSGGTVAIAGDSNLGTGTLQLNDGTLSVTSSGTIDNAITLGASAGRVLVDTGLAVSLSGAIGGAGALTKNGAGTLTLSGSNSYSGTTTVSAGTLSVAGDGNLGSSTVSVASGSTLQVTGAGTIDNSFTLSGTSTIQTDAAVTISGAIGGSGHLTKTGTGALSLTSGSSNYSGGTTLTAGTLAVQSSFALGSGTITFNGGGLGVTTTTALSFSNAVNMATAGSITFIEDAEATFSGAFSGTGGLLVTGFVNGNREILTLSNSGNSTAWSGAITATNAAIQFAADSMLSSGSITLNSGSVLLGTASTTVDNDVILGGAGIIFSNSGDLVVSGVMSGSGALTTGGTTGTTVTLSGNNTHTGSVTVAAAKLILSGGSAVGDNSAVTISNATTLELASNETIGSLAGTGSNTLALSSYTLTTGGNNSSTTFAGPINGTGGLVKTGSGTFTLSGTNTFTGGVQVSAGALTVSGGSAIANTVTVAVDSGATFNLSASETIGALSGAGTVQLSSNTLTTGVANSSTTFSGSINGGGNLSKSGTGTFTLSGTNNYTGTTTVSDGGTLSITDSSNISTNTVTLNNASILAVTGSSVTLANAIALGTGGGNVSNANSVTLSGVLSGSNAFTKLDVGTLTLSNTSTYSGATNLNAGTLQVTGALNATSALTVASGATLAGSGSIFASSSTNTVTVQSGGTVAPGVAGVNNGVAALTINGNLGMASGSTLAVDIYGTNPGGTDFDQVVINGTVDVSGATLSPTHNYTAGNGHTYRIIDNDAGDAITGTFSGLAEGSTLTAAGNGTVLTATYAGGTGNDFILTSPVNPVIQSVSASTANGTYKIGDTIAITVAFDQAVTVDTTGGSPSLQLETGTVDRMANYVSGSGTTTLTFSYIVQAGDNTADLDYLSTSALALNGSTIRDAGNHDANLTLASPGAANSLGANKALVIDGVRPTASIVVTDTALKAGETSLVTITFNEAVTGFTNADLTIANGTLSAVSSSDGGITWTATLTPTASIEDSTNLITLDNTGVQDSAGNAGTGTTDSNNYAIDTLRPVVNIALSDYALSAGETATVTFTFSEAVTGFTTADITAANGVVSGLSSSDGGITWTATFTPTTNTEDATNVIGVDNTGYQDAAGNTGTGSTGSINYTIDTLRPTATIVVADTALAAGETSLVTITMSEAVANFDSADLVVANGTLSGLATSDGGITWTATLTPTANITDTTNVITFDTAGVVDGGGNTGVAVVSSNNYAIDTLRPTATIVVADTALAIGETSLVTITFNEAVSGFTTADLTVANGSVSGLSSSDGGSTWTATLTPTANISDTTNVITLANSGVTDAAGNTGTGTTDSNNYVVDTLRPTATIVVADTALAAGETSLVTFTFSEAVTGFTNADVAVANGTLSAVSSSDGGITWTATLTPTANITDTTNLITFNNSGVQDLAGNAGTGTTDSNNYAIDTVRPTATIVVADTALAAGETSLVTITFSEAVSNFNNADLSVSNGTLSAVSSSDGGITWTATFTPSVNVSNATNLITLANTGVTDAAGNTGTGTTISNNYAIDTLRPSAIIQVADSTLTIGETSLVTITFNEAVTGFTNADLTVANGTLSTVSSSDGGITWTAIFTPTAGITDSTNIITLNDSGVTDAAGNTGSGTTDSNNYAIDTLRPTATIVVADNALAAGETSLVTITFSEAVTGFTNADLTIANGTLSAVSSLDGGITWTATLTPTANITDATNLITLNNAGVQDAAGNAGTGTTDSNNYAIDTLRPTASIVVADTALAAGETSLVTITFSEAVSNFNNADLSVSNGILSAVSSSDGGITWTATFTPTVNVSNATNLITLSNTGVTDAAGNTGTGSTSSNNYAIDTLRPSAIITVADTALTAGETSLVTITFNEAVTGFTNADLTVANGTLSAVSSSDGGITWTATLTPTANITDATNVITLTNTGVVDAAGNTGTGTTDSNNYTIDTERPAVTSITLQGTPEAYEQTINFLLTFSEPVNHVDLGDFSLSTTGNAVGSLGSLQQISDRSWQVTVNNINGNGTIRLDVKNATDITDSANNTLSSGFTTGANFTAQMLPPPPMSVPLVPLVTSTATDTLTQTPVSAALIVIPPDASQIGAPTNNTPLTTVEAPALATVVSTSLSVSGATNSPTSLDTSTPGADPIGVATATSTGTISTAPGSSPLGTGGSFTPGGPAKGPSIDTLNTNADSGLQNLPVIGRTEVQPGVPLYIPLPGTVAGVDANQQVSVDVRMQDGRPLVSWLKFDPVTGSLTGQAPKGFEGKLQILVTVRDSKGNAVSSIVELQVNDRDSKPVPNKDNLNKAKPGASIMGKPGLNDQFARYGKAANAVETDALLSAINQLSAIPATARKA